MVFPSRGLPVAPGSGRGYLLEILVAVDVLLVVGVLQPVEMYVLPQGLDVADGSRVQAQQPGRAGISLNWEAEPRRP